MPRKRKSSCVRGEIMKKTRNEILSHGTSVTNKGEVAKRLDERKMPSPVKKNLSEELNENYLIIKQTVLQSIITNCCCQKCKEMCLEVNFGKQLGLAQNITVFCKNCGFGFSNDTSSKVPDQGNSYDINRRAVVAVTELGKGHVALEKLSCVMNLPCMDSKTFTRHLKHFHSFSAQSLHAQQQNICAKVKDAHSILCKSSSDICNIAVSYDATWHKRGHTSNYAVGCVIDVLTGFVIDHEVLSKFCHNCAQTEKALGKESPEFAYWYKGHLPYCQKNYVGSSGGMEVEMALKLWRRSESLGFRYVEVVGDGDAKTFHELQASNVYGDKNPLKKIECVNHVGKRMGTALRKLVDCEKKRGVTLGGKKHGSLSDATIKKVTRYYRNAIIRNKGNILAMKRDIYAILQHCSSTDKKPKHTTCPLGSNSWCFYNRATGLQQKPATHKTAIKTPLREDIVAKMMPIFQRLASDSLLERCSMGETQNRNESIHNMIWSRCPKTVNCSKVRVDIAAARGVSDFNHGVNISALNVFDLGFISPCQSTITTLKKIRTRHVRKALFKSTESFKLYRKKVELAKIGINQNFKHKEGVTYSPGTF